MTFLDQSRFEQRLDYGKTVRACTLVFLHWNSPLPSIVASSSSSFWHECTPLWNLKNTDWSTSQVATEATSSWIRWPKSHNSGDSFVMKELKLRRTWCCCSSQSISRSSSPVSLISSSVGSFALLLCFRKRGWSFLWNCKPHWSYTSICLLEHFFFFCMCTCVCMFPLPHFLRLVIIEGTWFPWHFRKKMVVWFFCPLMRTNDVHLEWDVGGAGPGQVGWGSEEHRGECQVCLSGHASKL